MAKLILPTHRLFKALDNIGLGDIRLSNAIPPLGPMFLNLCALC